MKKRQGERLRSRVEKTFTVYRKRERGGGLYENEEREREAKAV